jgi:hypothetical protein
MAFSRRPGPSKIDFLHPVLGSLDGLLGGKARRKACLARSRSPQNPGGVLPSVSVTVTIVLLKRRRCEPAETGAQPFCPRRVVPNVHFEPCSSTLSYFLPYRRRPSSHGLLVPAGAGVSSVRCRTGRVRRWRRYWYDPISIRRLISLLGVFASTCSSCNDSDRSYLAPVRSLIRVSGLARCPRILLSVWDDAKQIGQSDFDALIPGEVNTFDSSHSSPILGAACAWGSRRSHKCGPCAGQAGTWHIVCELTGSLSFNYLLQVMPKRQTLHYKGFHRCCPEFRQPLRKGQDQRITVGHGHGVLEMGRQ